MTVDRPYLQKLRVIGVVEGISTLLLFGIAMPLKYLADMPIAVRIVGPIHGFLFLLLVYMFITAVERIPIPKRLASAGIFGAVIPFGPFVVDVWLRKVGE